MEAALKTNANLFHWMLEAVCKALQGPAPALAPIPVETRLQRRLKDISQTAVLRQQRPAFSVTYPEKRTLFKFRPRPRSRLRQLE
jgi:hypothetical protein